MSQPTRKLKTRSIAKRTLEHANSSRSGNFDTKPKKKQKNQNNKKTKQQNKDKLSKNRYQIQLDSKNTFLGILLLS